MKVKVEFVIETVDYGESEFKEEIRKLLFDIDPDVKLWRFSMKEEL